MTTSESRPSAVGHAPTAGGHDLRRTGRPAPTHLIYDRWRTQAACLNEDPELFFPATQNEDSDEYVEALAVCGVCAVTSQCLEWALQVGEDGVWGGTTPRQRANIRRRKRRAYTRQQQAAS